MDANRLYLQKSVNEDVIDLVDSSASSSDDEFTSLFTKRRNSLPKMENFIGNIVQSYPDTEFNKKFGISRGATKYLVDRYSSSQWFTVRNYKGGRRPKSAETHVLAFLWFAANKATYREIGYLFDMSVSNTYSTFNKVLNFIVKDLAPEKIWFPQKDQEKQEISREFENVAGFPNVLGCIDATTISSRKPKQANKNDYVSINLQAICDTRLRFLDVFTGVPSNIPNSDTKLSSFGKELRNACAPDYHLLGDSAFPLREYLLTPYRDCDNFSEAERLYNKKFFKTRVKIENAFGMLKSRFRQLAYLNFLNAEPMANFVIACCVLHNLCIERNELCDFDIANDDSENIIIQRDDRKDNSLRQLGQIRRNEIKNQLFNRKNQKIY